MRVVPSRRGLVVTFLGVAVLAYASGLGVLWLMDHHRGKPIAVELAR
jgi:hypothetical protein